MKQCDRVRELIAGAVSGVLAEDVYYDLPSFKTQLLRVVGQKAGEDGIKDVREFFELIFGDMNIDILDLFIMQGCVYYSGADLTTDNVSKFITDISASAHIPLPDALDNEVRTRCKRGRYLMYGFKLFDEKKTAPGSSEAGRPRRL
jgi:hypothetical protein